LSKKINLKSVLTMQHLITGDEGEQIAKRFLEKKGFRILHAKWRWKKYELDLIGLHEGFLVFVEVKTRNKFGLPSAERAVNKKKRKGMIRAANAYVDEFLNEEECRFDVVVVFLGSAHPEINYYPNAFYPRP